MHKLYVKFPLMPQTVEKLITKNGYIYLFIITSVLTIALLYENKQSENTL